MNTSSSSRLLSCSSLVVVILSRRIHFIFNAAYLLPFLLANRIHQKAMSEWEGEREEPIELMNMQPAEPTWAQHSLSCLHFYALLPLSLPISPSFSLPFPSPSLTLFLCHIAAWLTDFMPARICKDTLPAPAPAPLLQADLHYSLAHN